MRKGLKQGYVKPPRTRFFGLHSLNMLALLVYCYLGTVKEGSATFNVALLSTVSIGSFFFISLLLIYINRKLTYKAVFSNRNVLILMILAVVATLLTRTTIFLIPMLFALTAIGQDLRQLLKYYLLWSSTLFVSLMLFQLTGVITGGEVIQETADGAEILAQSLGFGNPNGAFTFLFSILVTAYVLLQRSSWKLPFTVLSLFVIFTIYSQTLSRTGLICCLLVVFFAYAGRFISWQKVKKFLPMIFIGLTLLSVILAVYYGQMGNTINDLMSNRPYWWGLRVNDGALSNILGNADSFAVDYSWWRDTAPLDSFFLRIWFGQGLIILIMFFIFFRVWSKKTYNEMLIFGALVALLYGFSEYGIMANPARNIILLIMMVPIFSHYMTGRRSDFFKEVKDAK